MISDIIIINIKDINIRCFSALFFLMVFILASNDMGTNQQLRIINGVANASVAKLLESLCQRDSL